MAAELQRLEHQGAAPATGLASGIGAGDMSFTLLSGTGYPTGAGGKLFIVSLDPGTAQEEHVLCSARSGTTVTVNNTAVGGRGFDNTSAASHSAGTTNVEHVAGAIELDDMNRHIYTTDDDHAQYAKTDGTRAFTGRTTAPGVSANLTGTSGSYVGSTNGAPISGTFLTGDFADDPTNNCFWICRAGGSPGTWVSDGGQACAGRMYATSDLTALASGSTYQVTSLAQDFVIGGATAGAGGIVVPTLGRYWIAGQASWSGTSGGSSTVSAAGFYSASLQTSAPQTLATATSYTAVGGNPTVSVTALAVLTASTAVTLYVKQTSGSAQGVQQGFNLTFLTAIRVAVG